MKRLFIVGDDAFMVHAMRFALRYSSGVNLFGVVDGQGNVREAVREAQPDIVIVDGLGDPAAGPKRVREVREEAASALVLLLTAPLDDALLREVLDAGAMVCLSTSLRIGALDPGQPETAAARPAAARIRLAEGTVNGAGAADAEGEDDERPPCPLTARELEILRAVAEGHTNARIGRQLWVTEQTVKFHLSNIYRKLGVSNRTEASRYALVNGLAGGARRAVREPRYVAGANGNSAGALARPSA
jgi:DNA-binding NarL/FixJ family response regulator